MTTQEASVALPMARASARAVRLPWAVLALAVAATSIVVGVIWDISWHSTIGRDTFWTPAHIAIYLGGVVGGLVSAYLILGMTFGGDSVAKEKSVRFWGFRGPLGAWWATWGCIAMLTSAPFDDWWHNAYGLDVEILSPPHTVLALGMFGVTIGALILAAALQNRAATEQPAERTQGGGLAWVFAYTAGVALALVAIMLTEFRYTNSQHAGTFYWVFSAVLPFFLIGPGRAARLRFPVTAVAAFYMLPNLVMIWILPLFAAQPMLAPIYNPVDRMVVDVWPMLLIVPAFAIDLTMAWWRPKTRPEKTRTGGDWSLAVVLGALFFAVFALVQWQFSSFLLEGDGASNAFFARDNVWSYGARLGDWTQTFWGVEGDPLNLMSGGIALVLAIASCRLGLAWGRWMSRVQR